MCKKVYIGEDKLIKMKHAMVGNDTNHRTFMYEDTPPYEEDEFEISGEGGNNGFFHVNESYGYSKTVDFSEVGKVEYQWDYFEDDYQEWLQNEGLQDSPEVKMEYIKDNVTFDVDFLDNQIYHVMGGESGLFYDDLENVFGESMAERMLNDCIENGSGSFETYEMYENESYDINNPQELNDIAMKLLPHGEYYKNCRGFILTNGVIVYTEGEHNDVLMIPGINNKFQFVELGNIRILDHSIDIGAEPTYEQEEVLRQILREYDGEEVYLDIFHDGEDIGVAYHSADYRYVMGEIDRFYSEGIRPQGDYTYESKTFSVDSDVMSENIETEVEASEVKLDSFKKNDTLAPKIWNGFDLNSRVRLKLLDIADDFWDYVNITWVKRKGIHLTGSICNFNWSKFSDIDLHLVVDFSEIDERKDFVQEYFDAKKNEWNKEHSKLKIFGYPVELYVEDVNAETASEGLYDLEENKWIKKPSSGNIKPIGLDKYEIKNKSAKIMTAIDDLYDEFENTDDDAQLRKIGTKAHKLLNKIKRMRKFGLNRGGESDSFNIIYKVLRRSDYMEQLWRLNSELYDKLNSIGIDETKILEIAKRFVKQSLNEEVVADGNADHNPFKQRWKHEREMLKNYLTNYGEVMTSKENGKQYKVLYDASLSSKLGINYCICIQWNPLTMEPGNIIYVRAFDKFTRKIFKPEFDTRGFDNDSRTDF